MLQLIKSCLFRIIKFPFFDSAVGVFSFTVQIKIEIHETQNVLYQLVVGFFFF